MAKLQASSAKIGTGPCLPPAVLGWHMVTCRYFTARCAMAPSQVAIFRLPEMPWHLRHLENGANRQICDSTLLSLEKCFLAGKVATASAHLEFFPADLAQHLLICKFFTCRVGMAPSRICQGAPKNKNDRAKIPGPN